MIDDALSHLRRPEYTGQNRCLPCTIVNLAIIAVVGAVVVTVNLFVGAFAIAAGVVLLALRGYVVPGTPRFAPLLVAPLPFDFGHANESSDTLWSASGSDNVDTEEVLSALVAGGVIEDNGTELFLDEDFRAAWNERMADLRTVDDKSFLDRIEDACPADVEGERLDDWIILAAHRDVKITRVVAIAETAAIETLAEWGIPESVQAPAAPSLRNFLRTCPSCGGDVSESTRRNCCGSPSSIYANPEQPVLACQDCESVVIELENT